MGIEVILGLTASIIGIFSGGIWLYVKIKKYYKNKKLIKIISKRLSYRKMNCH